MHVDTHVYMHAHVPLQVRALFADFTSELPGSGAKVYAQRNPYFLEVRQLPHKTAK